VHTVVVSVQHSPEISLEKLRAEVMEKVVRHVIPAQYMDAKTVVHINPCGDFIIGGPQVLGNFRPPLCSISQSAQSTFYRPRCFYRLKVQTNFDLSLRGCRLSY
jgi:S-adenosylmethionine synthetase, central domain